MALICTSGKPRHQSEETSMCRREVESFVDPGTTNLLSLCPRCDAPTLKLIKRRIRHGK